MIKSSYSRSSYDFLSGDRRSGARRFSWCPLALSRLPIYAPYGIDIIRSSPYTCSHYNYPYLGVELLLSGTLNYRFEEGEKLLSPGHAALMLPDRDSGFSHKGKGEYHKLVLLFSGAALKPLCRTLGLDSVNSFPIPDFPRAIRYCQEIFAILNEKTPGTESLLSEISYSFLLFLADSLLASTEENFPASLRNCLAFLERNFERELTIREIADAGGISVTSAVRIFHRHIGCTPWAYLQKMRLECAAGLLRNGNLRIKEVAQNSGFNDPLYFSSLFRKRYGVSPRTFRSQGTG